MSSTTFHLFINHVPVLTTIFSFLVLCWGVLAYDHSIKKVGLVGFVLSGILIIPVFITGEISGSIAHSIPDISRIFLMEHQNSAVITLWLTVILSFLSLIGLYVEHKKLRITNIYIAMLLVYSIITIGSLSYTAYLGLNIRHTELINSSLNLPSAASEDVSNLNLYNH